MAMHTTATDLKNRLGVYLDASRTDPVFIHKSGRPFAVLLSQERYTHLQALEDTLWGLRAQLAEQEGYLGPATTHQLLQELLRKDLACSPSTSPPAPSSSSALSTPSTAGK